MISAKLQLEVLCVNFSKANGYLLFTTQGITTGSTYVWYNIARVAAEITR